MAEAWQQARDNIKTAQARQKQQYDRHSREVHLKPGDRVMVHMPSKAQGKKWKVARPFHGPYRVLKVTPTNVEVRLVDKPTAEPIFVALNRVCLCYLEQEDTSWTGRHKTRQKAMQSSPSPGAYTC